MLNWIDPSFTQYFIVNWVIGGMVGIVIMMVAAGSVTALKNRNRVGGQVAGTGGCLFIVLSVLFGNLLFLVFNIYSLYLLFAQDRVHNFWFWVLVVLYILSTVHRLFPQFRSND